MSFKGLVRCKAPTHPRGVHQLSGDCQGARFIDESWPPRADEWRGADVPGGQETRVKDPATGGEKGSKLARFDLIPADVEWELAEHYGRGATKYEDRNWQRGYAWSLSYAALRRHLAAWASGEDVDEETGSNHMVAVLWHATALRWFQKHSKGTDDRPW